MSCEEEFTNPIASSTTVKKKKPEGWCQDPELTFQDHPEVSVISKDDGEVSSGGVSGNTLWKYILPANPGELEEDSFIVDDQVYTDRKQGSITGEDLPLKLAEDLAKLDVLSSQELPVNIPSDPSTPPIDPIPGFIITDRNVIIRRHSSLVVSGSELTEEESRKILSAPASLYVEEALAQELPAFTGLYLDEEEDHFLDESLSKNYAPTAMTPCASPEPEDPTLEGSSGGEGCEEGCGEGCGEVTTGVLDSCYLKPCDGDQTTVVEETAVETQHETSEDPDLPGQPDSSEHPDIPEKLEPLEQAPEEHQPVSVQTPGKQTPGTLNTVALVEPDNTVTSETLNADDMEVPPRSSRVSMGSLNTVPFVDPENSMTTESLLTPDPEDEQTVVMSQTDNTTTFEVQPSDPVKLTFDDAPHQHPDFSKTPPIPKPDFVHVPVKVRPEYQHPDFSQTPVRKHHSFIDRLLAEDYDRPVSVPPSHTLEGPCAVGIARKFTVNIENSADLWLQCTVAVDELTKRAGFTTKDRLIVQPCSVEELPVTLVARQSGLCTGSIEITVNSVIAGMLPSQRLISKITAVAEMPVLKVAPANIVFGVQVDRKEASFELSNASQYDLPLKIVLESEGSGDVFSLWDPVSRFPTAVVSVILPPGNTFLGYVEFSPFEHLTDCTGDIRVTVDCPGGAVLGSIPLRGTVGHYKLRIPTAQHSLTFKTAPGIPSSVVVNFRNTGNVATSVALDVSHPFTVSPEHIPSLVPGEDGTCEVSYFPATTEHLTGRLTLSLAEDEIIYEVPITASAVRKQVTTPDHSSSLLANKSAVHFGGSELGREREETLTLQNGSHNSLICLNLRIVGTSKVFYIVGDSISLSCDVVLAASSTQTITLGYTPLQADAHWGELVVTAKNRNLSFTIPLSGHGGTSQVTILDAKQTSSRLWVDIGRLKPRTRNTGRISLYNRGTRAAFVHGCVEEEGVWVNPGALIIPPQQSRDVFVIQEAREKITSHKVAQLKFYCGDELARQRFCLVLQKLSGSVKDLPFDPTLEFLGDCTEHVTLPPSLGNNDLLFEQKLFLGSIYQLYVSVVGERQQEVVLERNLLSYSSENNMSVANNVSTANVPQYNVLSKSSPLRWSLSMERLELSRPSGVFHVINESQSPLPFEVTFDRSLCTVSPSAGSVAPCGCSELSVTPCNPSKALTTTISLVSGGEKRTLRLVYSPPLTLGPRTLPDQSIRFPEVPAGTTSSAMLEFPNSTSELLRWELCSLAPTYRRDGGTMSRAEYLVFGVSSISGVTLPGARERIPLTFHPQEPGQFTQCWSLDVRTSGSSQTKADLSRKVVMEGVATPRSTRASVSRASTLCTRSTRPRDRVFLKVTKLEFDCKVGSMQSLSFKVGNPLKCASKVTLSALPAPFHLKYKEVLVEPNHSARIPIKFRPRDEGRYSCSLTLGTEGGELQLELSGLARS